MSKVLALKYRPQIFDDVVGQQAAVQTLKNAITAEHLHHAYLFTGSRGVGKTSLARIFAKSLNCAQGPTATPCNECPACREITEGRSMDVLEIDGASNTSVDDVRELREKIKYLPTHGKYKIYIIDEVHMLSTAAFNALLKTLEEPPVHALFVFATTDPQKLPLTILSRVLRFDFRRITATQVVAHLKKISAGEGIAIDDDALLLLAREGDGSMRDSLSLLDQVRAFSGDAITGAQVEDLLGLTGRQALFTVAEAILAQDIETALTQGAAIYSQTGDLKRFLSDLLEHWRNLLVALSVKEPQGLLDLPAEEITRLQAQAQQTRRATLERLFQLTSYGLSEVARASFPKTAFDVLLIRLCTQAEMIPIEEILAGLEGETPDVILSDSKERRIPREKWEDPSPAQKTGELRKTPHPAEPEKSWAGFMASLQKSRPQLAALFQSAQGRVDGGELRITFPQGGVAQDMLAEPERRTQLEELAKAYFGRSLAVLLKQPAAAKPGGPEEHEKLVQEAVSIFQPKETIVKGKS